MSDKKEQTQSPTAGRTQIQDRVTIELRGPDGKLKREKNV
jgi:hypothetical protein